METCLPSATDLHVIIFDEIDAICKARGSVRDGSGVHDTIVNQVGVEPDCWRRNNTGSWGSTATVCLAAACCSHCLPG